MSDVHHRSRPHVPPVVLLLAGAIIAVFVLTGQWDPDAQQPLYEEWGMVPAAFSLSDPHALMTLVTHVFMHGGVPHILMNMLAYLQGAPFIAQRLGGAKFLVLFTLSAIGGAAAFILINPQSVQPMVGASGAICGVFGAYFLAVRPTPQAAIADPQVRNAMLVFLGINVVLMAFLPFGIAWEAHLGGFITGGLAYLAMRPRFARGPWG